MGEVGGAIIFFLIIGGFIFSIRHIFHRHRDFHRALNARWSPGYSSSLGYTTVYIDRSYVNSKKKKCVIETSNIMTIFNNGDNFEEKFHQAMCEAQMRAITYNSETK